MPVSNEFKKAFAASKTAQSRWKDAKKVRPNDGNYFPSEEDVPNGQHPGRVTVDAVKDDKGTRVQFHNSLCKGEQLGKSWNDTIFLTSNATDPADKKKQEDMSWARLSKAVQVLCDVTEEEFDGWDLGMLAEELEKIDEEAPYVMLGVARNNGKVKKKGDIPKVFFNTYYNRLLKNEEIDEIEQENGDSDNPSTDGDGSYEYVEDGSEVEDGSAVDDGSVVDESSDYEAEGDDDGSVVEETDGGEEGEDGKASPQKQKQGRSSSRGSSGGGRSQSSSKASGSKSDNSRSSRSSGSSSRSSGKGSSGSGSKGSSKPSTSTSKSRSSGSGGKSAAKPVATAEAPEPKKGGFVWHRPKDAKGKYASRNALEFKVLSVDKRKKTCSLSEVDGKRKPNNIPFADVEVIEEEAK